jgi:hypothetical protein
VFAGCPDDLVRSRRLRCPDTYLAAPRFTGLVQVFLVRPGVMAFQEETGPQPCAEAVIEEAVIGFPTRYAAAPHGPGRSA